MNASRIVKYRMARLRLWARSHKRLLIVVGDLLLVALMAWQLFPLSDRETARSQVDMQIESYYEISADGRPVVYFSDINDTTEAFGGSLNADSIVTHKMQAPGFWVNRIKFIPSCFGRVITYTAPKPNPIVNWSSDSLHRFVFMQALRSDHRLAGLQRMRNELHYYVRKHDITDYGYENIVKFSAIIDRQTDSLQAIVDTLQGISRNAKLTIRYVTRYAVLRTTEGGDTINRRCRIEKTYNGEFCLVQMLNHHTPTFINPRLSVTEGMEHVLAKSDSRPHDIADSTMVADSTGVYHGELDKSGKPNGVGKKVYADGAYYEGYWSYGRRNGFGFYVSPNDYLQAGTWKDDVFKGERLVYNANRIYGIDLSRHQHEQKGGKYSIDWSDLRITSLGSATKKAIEGKVDYPVSFVYIKSTEGCTVVNPYYEADYVMARKKGIRAGAYHFFSTTTSGAQQAREFIKKTKFNKGDLCPVLDVEPTDQQVRQMGGARALLKSMEQWLEIVYNHTKLRPILYIGQTFAKKYLTDAPEITGNYLIWVARYGEYQPSLKLAIWQLSSDGRVRGIHGNVDINVFSGYKSQYDDFLKNHTFK